MKNKNSIYVITVMIAFAFTLVILQIGSEMNKSVSLLQNTVMNNNEIQIRSGMEDTLKVTRESIISQIDAQNLNILNPADKDSIIKNEIIPLKISSTSNNIILMQVSPTCEVLYSENNKNLPKNIIEKIKTGIDSSIEEGKIYSESNDGEIIEWIGIPPGVGEFKNNTKWVLVLTNDNSLVSQRSSSVMSILSIIATRLKLILIFSCLIVLVTTITIVVIQREAANTCKSACHK